MKRFTMSVLMFAMLACMSPAALLPLPTATVEPSITPPVIVTSTSQVMHYCFGIVQVDALNLRSEPSYLSPADGQGLKRMQIVTIIDTIGDWYQVETSDGRRGYAHAGYIKLLK